jgi:hypothetical protein
LLTITLKILRSIEKISRMLFVNPSLRESHRPSASTRGVGLRVTSRQYEWEQYGEALGRSTWA